MKLAEVTERHPRSSQIVTRSSNFVYTIWAVFGGFILHFLLSNYLNVLLKPSYEKPIDNAMDLLNRNIPIYYAPNRNYISIFKKSPSPVIRELTEQMVVPTNWPNYWLMLKDTLDTGSTATIAYFPPIFSMDDILKWYKSSERVPGLHPFLGHLANKKWPQRKVYNQICILFYFKNHPFQ